MQQQQPQQQLGARALAASAHHGALAPTHPHCSQREGGGGGRSGGWGAPASLRAPCSLPPTAHTISQAVEGGAPLRGGAFVSLQHRLELGASGWAGGWAGGCSTARAALVTPPCLPPPHPPPRDPPHQGLPPLCVGAEESALQDIQVDSLVFRNARGGGQTKVDQHLGRGCGGEAGACVCVCVWGGRNWAGTGNRIAPLHPPCPPLTSAPSPSRSNRLEVVRSPCTSAPSCRRAIVRPISRMRACVAGRRMCVCVLGGGAG